MNPCDIGSIFTRFLRILYQQEHCQQAWNGERVQKKRRLLNLPNSRDRKQADKTQLQICVTFHEKRWFRGQSVAPQRTNSMPGSLMQSACPDLETAWNWWLFFFFHFSLFEWERPYYPMHVPSLYCRGRELIFSLSQVHRWREIVSQDGPYPEPHPYT